MTGGEDRTRLLLVGIGHANLEVLRRLVLEPRAEIDLRVVSLSEQHHYSGMVPGFLRGTYREEQLAFELRPLTEAAGGEFIPCAARSIEPDRRRVRLDDGRTVGYDLVSFNVGSVAAGQETAGIREHALPVKPMSRAVELNRRLVELADRSGNGPVRVAVVGGGAAGFEVACCMAGRLDDAGRRRNVFLIEAGDRLLPGYSDAFRETAGTVLDEQGLEAHTGRAVTRVGARGVELGDGGRHPADLTVWLTGATALPLFRGSGLDLDDRGFLRVDDSLRSTVDRRILAAGDCATLAHHPDTPKAGVYAVRQGPILWKSIVAALEGAEPPRYEPQSGFLSLLNTGDGKALLSYKGFVSHSRWAWWLKDWIDRRFMRRYQRLAS